MIRDDPRGVGPVVLDVDVLCFFFFTFPLSDFLIQGERLQNL